MVQITASMVKELREKSGAAMMDCKKALVESSGDFDKAFEWLRQKGVATASKKSSRATSEGLIVGKISDDLKTAVLLEVNCETDFVARNEEFVGLCNGLVEVALSGKCKTLEDLLAAKHEGVAISERVTGVIAKMGENIVVKRLDYLAVDKEGIIGLYIHALGGKMGALIELSADKKPDVEVAGALARDLAMHIVSTKPQYLSRQEVPKETIEEERRIESGKSDLANKPPEIREKMIEGRVDKILAERCLSEQPFVKDPSQTVANQLKAKSKEIGATLSPNRFSLFILGDG
ncbi:MAG: translation elongation factor Ts [Candidatus Obscuribacterales bacterium]|nr:translation elongation factor Ts [Candidatus Obscuribacterales bacterium]